MVTIGGRGYREHHFVKREFNWGNDPDAVNYILRDTNVPVWQIPISGYAYIRTSLAVGFGSPPGIVQIHNPVPGSVNQQNPACVPADFFIWSHSYYVLWIASSQLHGTAAEQVRDVLRIKFCKHHFPCPGIIGDA